MCRDLKSPAVSAGRFAVAAGRAGRRFLALSLALGSAWLGLPADAKNPAAPLFKRSVASPPKAAESGKKAEPGPGVEVKKPELMAALNGEKVLRDELARECLKRFGEEVLDTVLHK